MNQSQSGSSSGRPSPRIAAETISNLLEFSQLNKDNPQTQESQQRTGGIRVSLACIPCRSRHVKCGAEVPDCSRCVQDDKPCFYTKSRRGIKDRKSTRGKGSICEADKDENYRKQKSSLAAYSSGQSSTDLYYSNTGASSNPSNSPFSISSSISDKSASPRMLFNLYYESFHKAHPFILPRHYFLSRLDTDPESLKFLLPVIHYIGSLFTQNVSSAELKDVALGNLELVAWPSDGFTVQALLLAAIATHGEDDVDRARTLLDRAIFLALELRMHSRAFAQMEEDLVLAESWRRTFWGLYITDGAFARIEGATTFLLYKIESTTDLPCEELDYEGIIPQPYTLGQYDNRDFQEHTTVFSSFAYLIDLTRIAGALFGLDRTNNNSLESAVLHADAMLVNWKLHLPREKQGIVGHNEQVDEMLFQAHNLLQILFVLIHRPLSRLTASPLEPLSRCVPTYPLPLSLPNTNSHDDWTYWMHTKKTIDAADAVINFYALPCAMLQHTPLVMSGLRIATLVNLSACTYLLGGQEWVRTRDRIRLGIGGLKAYGDVWARSRRVEKETRAIARGAFSSESGESRKISGGAYATITTASSINSAMPTSSNTGDFGLSYEHMNEHIYESIDGAGYGNYMDEHQILGWPELQDFEFWNRLPVENQQQQPSLPR